jgi:hypothetical protein
MTAAKHHFSANVHVSTATHALPRPPMTLSVAA